jgi:hypothetical protein
MNEADRVAAQRAAEAEHQRELEARAARQPYVDEVHRLARELSRVIPSALAARNRDDYRGIEQITYYTEVPAVPNGVERREHKFGAYLIWREVYTGKFSDEVYEIYLISDMRLLFFGTPLTVGEFAEKLTSLPKGYPLVMPEQELLEMIVNKLRDWGNASQR